MMSPTKMKKSTWVLKCSPYGSYNSFKIFDLNYGVVNFLNLLIIIIQLTLKSKN